ncbi:MAG: hypothetical protein IV086_08640 [Hyphomonadaceae bacterium]|nr:MAG: hypothetical protein FD160_391 [Caulobacteraceae bacterium]MBT9445751.1 hypothetical protein [Hyphomonadaceae bacterium]TPW07257.1 MAG: hypothetical protein FD124_1278 [Alphaproteobacteria bacterium]
MPQVLPYRPVSTEIDAALSVLESATSVDRIATAYAAVNAEAGRRAKNVLAFCAIVGGGAAILIAVSQYFQWLPYPDSWAYALLPIAAITLGSNLLRSDTAKDDARIHSAVVKWRKQIKPSRV